jgi:hypothetical protein
MSRKKGEKPLRTGPHARQQPETLSDYGGPMPRSPLATSGASCLWVAA